MEISNLDKLYIILENQELALDIMLEWKEYFSLSQRFKQHHKIKKIKKLIRQELVKQIRKEIYD